MMKFSFIAGLILAIMSCNNAPQTTVSLHVEGAKADVPAEVVTKDSVYSVTLDSTGLALITLADNFQPGYASLKYGRVVIPVYVEPGKSFDVSLKQKGRRMTPVFTGEGAKKNDYLNSKVFFQGYPDFKADESAFISDLEERENKLLIYLDSMAFENAFIQSEKKRIHALVYGSLTSYPSYHGYYSGVQNFKPSERYYEVLKAAAVEDESMLNVPVYQELIAGTARVMAGKDMTEYDALTLVKNKLDYIQKNFQSPKIQEFFVDEFITEYVNRSGVERLDDLTSVYNAKVTSPEKKAKFDELCSTWAKIAKGQPSPAFKYTDINGKEVSLADLAGKYVYIDVWATWCGPCRGELPHLKKLEHQYKNKNIAFVSISCDQDKAAWEKMVKSEKLGGIQLHNGGDREFMRAYIIKGIPRFILLDREGKIINSDMSRPSDAKTAETFRSLKGI